MQCFVCGEAKGVVLLGLLPNDEEAPRKICLNQEPCDKCKDYMRTGIIMISVRDGESGDTPFRTGGWCVVKAEAVLQIVNDPELIKRRVMFVPDNVWNQIGLPERSAT